MIINIGSLIACFVVCLLLWYVVSMLVKPQPFRNVGFVVVVVVFTFWLLVALGIWSPFAGGNIRVR
jgi:hypothetical protein